MHNSHQSVNFGEVRSGTQTTAHMTSYRSKINQKRLEGYSYWWNFKVWVYRELLVKIGDYLWVTMNHVLFCTQKMFSVFALFF